MPESPSSVVLFDLKGSDMSRIQTINTVSTLDLFFSFRQRHNLNFFYFVLFILYAQ